MAAKSRGMKSIQIQVLLSFSSGKVLFYAFRKKGILPITLGT
jgi:hypothetical protein